jgi:hypothetical protein
MAQQVIKLKDNGARSMRVLDVLTPLNGSGAPAVNAAFLGQKYIDTTNKVIYMSVAVGSAVAANDWFRVTPLSGDGVPAVNATYLGQIYIDSTNKAAYTAIAVGSAVAANDWQKMAAAV